MGDATERQVVEAQYALKVGGVSANTCGQPFNRTPRLPYAPSPPHPRCLCGLESAESDVFGPRDITATVVVPLVATVSCLGWQGQVSTAASS